MPNPLVKRHPLYYVRYWDRYLKRLVFPVLPSHRPDFLIIGAQKAATTSLYNYLNQLPGICGAGNKEIYYFDREQNFGRNDRWYHSHFKAFSKSQLFFEATPNYFYYPWVPRKIYEYNPHLKLVVVLRNPVSRAFSAWNMYKDFFDRNELYRFQKGLRPSDENFIFKYFYEGRNSFPAFEECLDIELDLMDRMPDIPEPALLRRGLYSEQIERYYAYFSMDQIYFVGYRELVNNPQYVVANIYSWLFSDSGHPVCFETPKRNPGTYNSKMKKDTEERLIGFFKNEYEKVCSLIGRRVEW